MYIDDTCTESIYSDGLDWDRLLLVTVLTMITCCMAFHYGNRYSRHRKMTLIDRNVRYLAEAFDLPGIGREITASNAGERLGYDRDYVLPIVGTLARDYHELTDNGRFALPSKGRLIDNLVTGIPLVRYLDIDTRDGRLSLRLRNQGNYAGRDLFPRPLIPESLINTAMHMAWFRYRFESVVDEDHASFVSRIIDLSWWKIGTRELRHLLFMHYNFNVFRVANVPSMDSLDKVSKDTLKGIFMFYCNGIHHYQPRLILERFLREHEAILGRENARILSINSLDNGTIHDTYMGAPMLEPDLNTGTPFDHPIQSLALRDVPVTDGTANASMDNDSIQLDY